jgi:hypothetical protein
MIRILIRTVVIALFAAPLFAVTIGELQPGGGTVASREGDLAPLTIISVSRPALSSGSVDRATVIWTGAPAAGCANAFKIKFFRATSSNGVQVFAERGPFEAKQGILNVVLNPPVNIQADDMIGVTQLQSRSCGGVVNRRTDMNEVWGSAPGDPTSGTVNNIDYTHGLVPSVRASSDASPIHGFLPVVGSTQGGFGSLFKTSVQLTNRGAVEITGRLVFHRAGISGAVNDPSVVYTLRPNETQTIDDVVVATGTTGIGSLDVVPTSGYAPDVTARIYNDAGAAGTSGFTEELMTPYEAMTRFTRGSFTIPADLTNYRMNIGIRSLESGVEMNIIQYDASGVSTGLFLKRTYPANFFEQMTVSQFIDGAAVAPGGYLVVQIEAGSAFIYSTVTDNRTNDSSIRFPEKF